MGTIGTILHRLHGDAPTTTVPGNWQRSSMRSAVVDLLVRIHLRFAKRQSRLDLTALSDHHLRDIGLTREQAEREAGRSFWD